MLAEADSDGNALTSLLVETFNVYPGEIKAVTLESPIFGADAGAQAIFTCTAPKYNASGEFVDYQCSARSVAGDVTVSLQAKFGDSVAFKLDVPSNVLAGLGDFVDAKYTISFRAPTDLNGEAFLCGDVACPARPNITGNVGVRLASDIAVVRDLTIGVGSEAPTSFAGLTSLDMSRELNLTGAVVPGAFEYSLTIFCAGSLPGESFLPEEQRHFFAPARDAAGRVIQPEFHIFEPWLGGRSCDFTFEAMLESEAGDFIGVSSLTFSDVVLSGGTGGAGDFIDNELKLAIGDSACLVMSATGQPMVTTQDCTPETTLATLEATIIEAGTEPSALLLLGSGVQEAFADGGRKEMTAGRLEAGAVVALDVDLNVPEGEDIAPPSCGVISTDELSNFCGPDVVIESLQPIFFVNDNNELTLHPDFPMPMQFASPDSTEPLNAVSLTQPGFYALVDPDNGEKIIEIAVDTFEVAAGVREVFANFTLTAGGNHYDGTGDNSFSVGSPAFMYMLHDSGQPVEFDVRYIRDGSVKVAWFMPPPRMSLVGEHDINGDQTTDLTIAYDDASSVWTFSFASSLQRVEQFGMNGPVVLEAESGEPLVATLDQNNEHFTDFFVAFENTQYQLYIQLQEPGQGFIEWFEVFGGPIGGPGDGPTDCVGCGGSLFDFGVKAGEPVTLFDGGDLDGYNTWNAGAALINFEVIDGEVTASIADGASSEAYFAVMNMETGAIEQVTTFTMPLGQPFSSFISFFDSGKSLDIEIFDTGFDVAIRLFDHFNDGGYEPYPPEPVKRDTDMDGWYDFEDNCVIVPNDDQLDSDGNGIGDACEAVGPDMSGIYMAVLTPADGSEVFDEDTGACVPAEVEKLLVKVRTVGAQVFISEASDDDPYEGLQGLMGADGSFSVMGGDRFSSDGGIFDELAGTFSFSFNEVDGYFDDFTDAAGNTAAGEAASETTDVLGVSCETFVTVEAFGPDEVVEQAVLANGVSWFEVDDYYVSGGVPELEIEYGTIADGADEVFFYWDFDAQAWQSWTETKPEEYIVTSTGIVASNDVYRVTGYVQEGETAILQPLSGDTVIDEVQLLVDLAAFDVSGMLIEDLVGPLAEGLAPGAVFSEGAQAYVTELTHEATYYSLDCDNEWLGLDLACQNAFLLDWMQDDLTGESSPVLAQSLDDVVVVSADLMASSASSQDSTDAGSTAMDSVTMKVDASVHAVAIYVGEGMNHAGEFSIHAYIASDDGLSDGANLVAYYMLNYRNGYGEMETLGTGDATLTTLGGMEAIELIYPEFVKDLLEDDEGSGAFVIVESELDQQPLARVGEIVMAGDVERTLTLNAVAKDDIVTDFALDAPSMPSCETDPSYCEPPTGECPVGYHMTADGSCQPDMSCPPEDPNCVPPTGECPMDDPDCMPPAGECPADDPNCAPPSDCPEGSHLTADGTCQPDMTCPPEDPNCVPPTGECPMDDPDCMPPAGECPADDPNCVPPSDCPEGSHLTADGSCQPDMTCPPEDPNCVPPTGECPMDDPDCMPPAGECPADDPNCVPPSDCDPSVEACEPPPACDPSVETCEPMMSGDPIEGAGWYANECEACHGIDGVGGFAGDVVPVKEVYLIGTDEVDLITKIVQTMPPADPTACDQTCAENIAAYLHSMSGSLP